MMEERKKEVTVYMVGECEFTEKGEAERYEKELQNKLDCTYYRVTCGPDLTEGRGYSGGMIVAVQKSYTRNAIHQFLLNKLGKPIEKVMGVSPMDNWIIREGIKFDDVGELDKFLNKEIPVGIGDYRSKKVPSVYYIDSAGEEVNVKGHVDEHS